MRSKLPDNIKTWRSHGWSYPAFLLPWSRGSWSRVQGKSFSKWWWWFHIGWNCYWLYFWSLFLQLSRFLNNRVSISFLCLSSQPNISLLGIVGDFCLWSPFAATYNGGQLINKGNLKSNKCNISFYCHVSCFMKRFRCLKIFINRWYANSQLWKVYFHVIERHFYFYLQITMVFNLLWM